MANIPSNLSYGTVHGKFIVVYQDLDDSGSEPNIIPAVGSVFFTPSPTAIKNVFPDPVTVLPAGVEANLDSEGYLCGYGTERGISLIATDDPDGNPVDWTWKADFRLTEANGTPIILESFSFSLPGGSEVDLTSLAPVPAANGTFYNIGPEGPQGIQGIQGIQGEIGPANTLTVGTVEGSAPGAEPEVEITGTSPNQTINFVLPTGATGPQGPQGDPGGFPAGGATNDFMVKSSSIDYDVEWTNIIDGGSA